MGAFTFLREKLFWKHLGIAVASAIVFLWLVFFSLKLFTRHGRSQLVPDLTGLTVPEATKVAERYGLVLQVSDSTFVGGRQKGTVVSHVPRSDERVKKGRRVFVTINAFSVPRVPMPNVMGVSYRQAKVTLESSGLKVGKMIYRPDPMRKYVLGQRYQDNDIELGTLIARGESVDLVLGQGYSGQSTEVTEVVGMTFIEASDALNNGYINIGAVSYDGSVKTYADSLNARVYKQQPFSGRVVRLGSYVDLWLTINQEQYTTE